MAAKNYTRGAKRRAKKEMPGLAGVPKKQPNGRKRRPTGHVAESNPERTVLEARARHAGSTPKEAADMRNPALSEDAGRAIHAVHSGEKEKRLWEAYRGFTAAEATYHKHYLGQGVHPKTAKLEMMRERIETRADDRPDLRDEEQRARDASNNWMRWRGHVMRLTAQEQSVLFDVAYGRAAAMDAGQITPHGRRFVAAVERLADVLDQTESHR